MEALGYHRPTGIAEHAIRLGAAPGTRWRQRDGEAGSGQAAGVHEHQPGRRERVEVRADRGRPLHHGRTTPPTPLRYGSTSSGSTRAISSPGSRMFLTVKGRIPKVAASNGENSP